MRSPLPAYEGDEPFVFVSYAHADADRVYGELEFLRNAGINIWYDEGIQPGSRWSDELANAIDQAELFLVFLTPAAVASENCLNEIDFALRRRRPFLSVELEPVTLPPGIELNIGHRQSILSYRFSEADYRARLLDAIRRGRTETPGRRGVGAPHAPLPSEPSRKKPRTLALSASVLLLAALAAGIALISRDEKTPHAAVETVAVLPFAYLSQGNRYEYLADGLADELITLLGGVSELSVSSRISSFYFRDQAPSIEDIRERLGVQYAIEGSVRQKAEGIVVNVSLIETDQGRSLWSSQFEASAEAIGELGTEIAVAIVTELRPDAKTSLLTRSESNRKIAQSAYEAYLRGLDYLYLPPSSEVLAAAEIFFQTALDVEPSFARAAAALCETYLTRYRMARTEDIQSQYREAEAQCEAALALDPTSWSGHQALATLYRISGRYEQALEEIRLADTLQPDTASVQYEYGKILTELGALAQAEERLRKGTSLDPGFWGGWADLGDFLYMQGRYEEALEQFLRVQDLTPDNDLMLVSLGATYYMLGDTVAAHASWKRSIRKNPESKSRAFWQAATWLGLNSLAQHCPEESAYWQHRAIAVSPHDHRLWGRLAAACQLQQADAARPDSVTRQIYRRAIALAELELNDNPNEWETLGSLALYRSRTGGEGASQTLVEKMLELQPTNPDALEIAVHFAHETGDEDARTRYTERLLALNFPAVLLERDPYLSGRGACMAEASEKERLTCSQGNLGALLQE